jgi:hypothetical protein
MQIKFCKKVQKLAAEIYMMQCIMKGLKSVNLAPWKRTYSFAYSPKLGILISSSAGHGSLWLWYIL